MKTLLIILTLFLSGCYGTAIDTRDIIADEVTITHHTPWSQLTITAKGWQSAVKTKESFPVPPAENSTR